MIVSLKNRNAELDEKRKKALHDYYETAAKLEDAQGIIVKLTAQVNHNYENSSMPSSKCIGRKKITNNREKTGKKPGAQKGRPHHPRKPMKPDKIIDIQTEDELKDSSRYVPTEKLFPDKPSGSPSSQWSRNTMPWSFMIKRKAGTCTPHSLAQ